MDGNAKGADRRQAQDRPGTSPAESIIEMAVSLCSHGRRARIVHQTIASHLYSIDPTAATETLTSELKSPYKIPTTATEAVKYLPGLCQQRKITHELSEGCETNVGENNGDIIGDSDVTGDDKTRNTSTDDDVIIEEDMEKTGNDDDDDESSDDDDTSSGSDDEPEVEELAGEVTSQPRKAVHSIPSVISSNLGEVRIEYYKVGMGGCGYLPNAMVPSKTVCVLQRDTFGVVVNKEQSDHKAHSGDDERHHLYYYPVKVTERPGRIRLVVPEHVRNSRRWSWDAMTSVQLGAERPDIPGPKRRKTSRNKSPGKEGLLSNKNPQDTERKQNEVRYLSSAAVNNYFTFLIDGNNSDFISNGSVCLNASYWPAECEEFFTRRRLHGWPSQAAIGCIRSRGPDVMPSSDDDWLWDFSRAGTDLMRTLPSSYTGALYLLHHVTSVNTLEGCNCASQCNSLSLDSILMNTVLWEAESGVLGQNGNDEGYLGIYFRLFDRLLSALQSYTLPGFFLSSSNVLSNHAHVCCVRIASSLLRLRDDLHISLLTPVISSMPERLLCDLLHITKLAICIHLDTQAGLETTQTSVTYKNEAVFKEKCQELLDILDTETKREAIATEAVRDTVITSLLKCPEGSTYSKQVLEIFKKLYVRTIKVKEITDELSFIERFISSDLCSFLHEHVKTVINHKTVEDLMSHMNNIVSGVHTKVQDIEPINTDGSHVMFTSQILYRSLAETYFTIYLQFKESSTNGFDEDTESVLQKTIIDIFEKSGPLVKCASANSGGIYSISDNNIGTTIHLIRYYFLLKEYEVVRSLTAQLVQSYPPEVLSQALVSGCLTYDARAPDDVGMTSPWRQDEVLWEAVRKRCPGRFVLSPAAFLPYAVSVADLKLGWGTGLARKSLRSLKKQSGDLKKSLRDLRKKSSDGHIHYHDLEEDDLRERIQALQALTEALQTHINNYKPPDWICSVM